MAKMVEVNIDSVRVSLTNQQRIVVLREVDAERYLPIWIGPYEAEAITIALQEIEVARPQTHDLLKNMIQQLNAQLLRVEVLALREDVFYGNIVVDVDGNIVNIDSRPSDALALASRTRVPIMVSEEVLESAGIEPDMDVDDDEEPSRAQTESEKSKLASRPGAEAEDDRLSIFEDFIENLDMDMDIDNFEDDSEDSPSPGG